MSHASVGVDACRSERIQACVEQELEDETIVRPLTELDELLILMLQPAPEVRIEISCLGWILGFGNRWRFVAARLKPGLGSLGAS